MIRLLRKATLLITVIIVLVLGIGAANCSFLNSGTVETKVNFLHDWNEALSRAQSENKPIMIDFYTEWCQPCKLLDSNTFSDDDLSAFLNSNLICLKSNAGESSLYQNYGIEGVPTTVFISPVGEEIGRMVGYSPPDTFYQNMQAILSRWEP